MDLRVHLCPTIKLKRELAMGNIPKSGAIETLECHVMEVWKWSFEGVVGYTCTAMIIGPELKIHSEVLDTVWGDVEWEEFLKKHMPRMKYICEVDKDPNPFLHIGEQASYQLWTTKDGMEYLLAHKLDKLLGHNFTTEQLETFKDD